MNTLNSAASLIAAGVFLATPAFSQKVGSRFDIASTGDIERCDVAYSDSKSEYLVVWERKFGSVAQIYGQRVTRGGALISSAFSLTSGFREKSAPTVAYVAKTQRWLVAWQEKQAGKWQIRGRTVTPGSGAQSTTNTLVASGAEHVEPELSGDRTVVDDDAILVYRSIGSGLRARQVSVRTSGAPTAHATVRVLTTNSRDLSPQISSNGGQNRRHVVTWRRDNASTDDIYARALNGDGMPIGATLSIAATGFNDANPTVDGDGEYFLVSWARREFLYPGNSDIVGRMLRVTGNIATLLGPSKSLAATASVDERLPTVAFARDKFVVSWSRETTNGYHLRLRMLAPTNMDWSSNILQVSGSKARSTRPVLGATYSGARDGNEAMLAYITEDALSPFDGDVEAQLLRALGSGGPIADVEGGCGFGGKLTAHGPLAIGNPAFRLRLGGADLVSSVALLNVAPMSPPLLTCGPCQISAPSVLLPMALTSGSGQIDLAIPHQVSLLSSQVQFQAYVFDTTSTPCVGIENLAFSNRLNASIGQ